MPYPHTELTGAIEVDGVDTTAADPVTND